MNITLNGKLTSFTPNQTILDFLLSLHISLDGIAIAKNFSVVPKSKWKETFLQENDIIEIVQAFQGG